MRIGIKFLNWWYLIWVTISSLIKKKWISKNLTQLLCHTRVTTRFLQTQMDLLFRLLKVSSRSLECSRNLPSQLASSLCLRLCLESSEHHMLYILNSDLNKLATQIRVRLQVIFQLIVLIMRYAKMEDYRYLILQFLAKILYLWVKIQIKCKEWLLFHR